MNTIGAWIHRHPTATLRLIVVPCGLAFLNSAIEILMLYGNLLLAVGLASLGGVFLFVGIGVEIEL